MALAWSTEYWKENNNYHDDYNDHNNNNNNNKIIFIFSAISMAQHKTTVTPVH